MALQDKDIFMAICERYADQPIEFIMAQYEKARLMNMEIERRSPQAFNAEVVPTIEIDAPVEDSIEEAPKKKRYNKRSFKVKPANAITEDAIYCCICGEERQSITKKHLATHSLTPEEYKKICGYPESQPLMSGRKLAKSHQVIALAQRARMEKKAAMAED